MSSIEELNTEVDPTSVLLSEQDMNSIYEKTLTHVRQIFENGGQDIEFAVEILAPYLNASEELSSCTPIQAQVIYSKISKGYSLVSSLYAKARFDRDVSISNHKTLRGRYYLEEFSKYVSDQKSKGISIKDTDASREHYLNCQKEIIDAKVKVDFYDALITTLEGWQKKLHSDMGNAKNLTYTKRFNDDLSTKSS